MNISVIKILVSLSALILFGYTFISVLISNKQLDSLSESYYTHKKQFNKGWLFQVNILFTVLLLLPAWLEISEGSTFQFLTFLAPVSLAFVAAAPNYKSRSEGKIHFISALITLIISLCWAFLIAKLPYIIGIVVLFYFIVIPLMIERLRYSIILFSELSAFIITYLSIFYHIQNIH